MAEIASAFVTLIPTFKGGQAAISRELGPAVDKAGKTAGKRFGGGMSAGLAGVGTKIFAPLAAAGAAIQVGDFLKDAVGEARESQKVGAITKNVIETTGGAAKVTADEVGKLSTAISNTSGIDDEAIQSASNLLLTFTNVRNEVGAGNDVFNQATQAATDLGAALGKDPKSAAIQLGKALNDPVKGVTALSRSGVSFTAQQKEQIKTLTESGDTLGAQKIILGEVNKEFGGTAAASADAGDKLKVAFGNFKEQVGTALLPIVDKFAILLTEKIIPAVSGFFEEMQTGEGAGGKFVEIVKGIWDALKRVGDFIMNNKDLIGGYFKLAWTVMSGPIKLIIAAVRIVIAVIRAIRAVQVAVQEATKKAWNAIKGAIVSAVDKVKSFLSRAWDVIKSAVSRAWDAVKNTVKDKWEFIKAVVSGAIDRVKGYINTLSDIPGKIAGYFQRAYEGAKQKLTDLINFVKGIPARIGSALGNLGTRLYNAGKYVIEGLLNGIKAKVNEMLDWVGGIAQKIKDKKGPEAKDKKLLIPAGRWIIGGLQEGLESQYGSVHKSLTGLTRSLSVTGSTQLPPTAAGAAGVARSGYQPVYNVTVANLDDMVRKEQQQLGTWMTAMNLTAVS